MKFLLSLLAAVALAPAAWAASMMGHLHLADGKTFPEGTKVSVYHEATKARGEAPVDAAGNFVVEGLEAGEKLRLTLPVDYEITTVSTPFAIDAEQIARNPMSPTVMGAAAPELTVEVVWKDHQTKWAEMRRHLVRVVSEGFFKAAKLTPEQQETFITLRVECEARVLKDLHEHRTSFLSPAKLQDDLCAALQKNMGDDMARQFRQYQVDQLGWLYLQTTPGLNANDWLTADEQAKLVHVWGPIFHDVLDHAMDPEFQKSIATREAKLAMSDKISASYLNAAKDQLSPSQFVKLQERFVEMRKQAIAEMDKGEADK